MTAVGTPEFDAHSVIALQFRTTSGNTDNSPAFRTINLHAAAGINHIETLMANGTTKFNHPSAPIGLQLPHM
jgi:hypothetical protein